jgi:hypothetical protein
MRTGNMLDASKKEQQGYMVDHRDKGFLQDVLHRMKVARRRFDLANSPTHKDSFQYEMT